jgi:hypothetical protein
MPLCGTAAPVTLAAMNAAILLVGALATSDAPVSAVDASFDDEATALQGAWEVVAVTWDGKECSQHWWGERWTVAGDELKHLSGGFRIAAGTTRLDCLDCYGVVHPGVYRIGGDTLGWTRSELVITFRRVRE